MDLDLVTLYSTMARKSRFACADLQANHEIAFLISDFMHLALRIKAEIKFYAYNRTLQS